MAGRGTTPGVMGGRARTVLAVAWLLAMLVGLAMCLLLTAGHPPEISAVPGVLALGAGVLLLGLGALPTIGVTPSARFIGAVAGVWAVGGIVTAWVRTAEQVGVSPAQVGVGQFSEVMGHGAPELVATACALLVVGWAVVDIVAVQSIPVESVAILAGIGVVAPAIAGHASTHALAPVLVGAHALAAGWWCGTLAALVVTVRGRSGWASALPEFSRRAVWAVGVLVVTGVIAAVVELGSVSAFLDTGYGRIIVAKVVGLVVLVAAARRYRTTWVPAVARHTAAESTTIRRAVVHILMMALVLGLAVGLSATAP